MIFDTKSKFGKALRLRSFGVAQDRSGQAMVEYVVVAGILLASTAIMTLFLSVFRDYGTRVLNLVGSEYP